MSMLPARIVVGAVLSVAAFGLFAVPSFAAATAVNGGGSSFVELEMANWEGDVARAPYNLHVNYLAQGSAAGRAGYISGNFDFGITDVPFQPGDQTGLARSGRSSFVYVPVSVGGVGLMYNVIDTSGQRITNLTLTRQAACQIFTSEIDLYWDDPAIAVSNPEVALPHQLVRAIVRADEAGASYTFSQYCMSVAPSMWSAFVAAEQARGAADDSEFVAGRPTALWPTGFGNASAALAAAGVASVVAFSGSGTIGFNETALAATFGVPLAALQNSAGVFVAPNYDTVTAGTSHSSVNPDGTVHSDLANADAGAYLPAMYSYVIAQTSGFDPAKGQTLASFLCYAVTTGQRQQLTDPLGYAGLTQPVVDIAHAVIEQIAGAPQWEQCAPGSGVPLPVPETPWTPLAAIIGAVVCLTASRHRRCQRAGSMVGCSDRQAL